MLTLTAQNFDAEVTKFTAPVVVDFWAPWCGPCRTMGPIFEELAQEMPDLTFAKVNVDEAPDLAMRFNVLSIPTLIIMKAGSEIGRLQGATTKDVLKEKLASVLS